MDGRLALPWRSSLTALVRTLIVLASTSECGCSTARIHEVHEGAGAIVVKVRGPPWGLVPDADVHIQDSTGHVTRSGRTNSCGVAVFEPLPEGTYSVRVGVEGADDAAAERVPVMHGADSWVEMKAKGASVESTARSKVSNCPRRRSCPGWIPRTLQQRSCGTCRGAWWPGA